MIVLADTLLRARWLWSLLLAVGAYGFFGLGIGDEAGRIMQALWNLGHIVFFLLLGMLLLQLAWPRRIGFWALLAGSGLVTLAAGAMIELIQSHIGRTMSLQDLLLDVLGMLLAVVFFAPQRTALTRRTMHGLQFVSLSLLLVATWPLYKVMHDDLAMHRQFPVLADFSALYELSRWSTTRAALHIEHSVPPKLRAHFFPAPYSTIHLEHFPSDWRDYKSLFIELTNPEADACRITVRIHDRAHDLHGHAHDDRYNRNFLLVPGRQRIQVELQEVKAAPASRQMNMSQIRNMSLFMTNTTTEQFLFVHKLYME